MDRRMSWCLLLASTLLPAAEAAEPGFYIGATASRVEQEVDGGGIGGFAIVDAFLPPPAFGGTPFPRPPIITPELPPAFVIGNPLTPSSFAPDRVEVDDGHAGWSVTLGYRVNQYLAAEVAYVDFGETSVTEFSHINRPAPLPPINFISRYDIAVSGPAASVIGSLPLGSAWQLFLRGGVLFADQEVEYPGAGNLEITYGDEVWMAGAGVQWAFASRWSARLEYQRTDDLQQNDIAGETQLEQASLSVLFNL